MYERANGHVWMGGAGKTLRRWPLRNEIEAGPWPLGEPARHSIRDEASHAQFRAIPEHIVPCSALFQAFGVWQDLPVATLVSSNLQMSKYAAFVSASSYL